MPTPQRKAIIKSFENGQTRCPFCNTQFVYNKSKKGVTTPKNTATFDHIIPVSHDGSKSMFNGIIVCQNCNNKRSNLHWNEWVKSHNFDKKYENWLLSMLDRSLEFHNNQYIKVDEKHYDQTISKQELSLLYDEIFGKRVKSKIQKVSANKYKFHCGLKTQKQLNSFDKLKIKFLGV